MEIFISSVIGDLGEARDEAAASITTLGGQPKRAEDFGASPDTPQRTCLAGVRAADAVLLILGTRYGEPQHSGLSTTHEEYREAKERCPVLVFVQENVEMEPVQLRFLEEVRGWSSGHYTESWTDPEDLGRRVTRVLHDFELSRSLGALDEEEVLQRADAFLPDERYGFGGGSSLVVAISGGPVSKCYALVSLRIRPFFESSCGRRPTAIRPCSILEQGRGRTLKVPIST